VAKRIDVYAFFGMAVDGIKRSRPELHASVRQSLGCRPGRGPKLGARLGHPTGAGADARTTTVLMRKALAEFIGTALLLIAVIGSGIAAQGLSLNCSRMLCRRAQPWWPSFLRSDPFRALT
jgi:hypothetical protein